MKWYLKVAFIEIHLEVVSGAVNQQLLKLLLLGFPPSDTIVSPLKHSTHHKSYEIEAEIYHTTAGLFTVEAIMALGQDRNTK